MTFTVPPDSAPSISTGPSRSGSVKLPVSARSVGAADGVLSSPPPPPPPSPPQALSASAPAADRATSSPRVVLRIVQPPLCAPSAVGWERGGRRSFRGGSTGARLAGPRREYRDVPRPGSTIRRGPN